MKCHEHVPVEDVPGGCPGAMLAETLGSRIDPMTVAIVPTDWITGNAHASTL